jgi:hypothetical protein
MVIGALADDVVLEDGFNDDSAFIDMVLALEPGPTTMALLCSIELASLDPYDRVLVLRAWERQQAWVMARTQGAILAITGEVRSSDDDWSREEVACALQLSNDAAGQRIYVARTLARLLPDTLRHLAQGLLGWRHALAIVDACADLDPETAAMVEQRVLKLAGEQTLSGLRGSLRRAVIKVAPLRAAQRCEEAAACRNVELFPMGDGLASLSALLPALEAQAAFEALDAVARANKGATDSNGNKIGLEARRADALVALITGVGTAGEQVLPRPVELQVVIDLPTLVGLRENPAELVGYGPIPGGLARDLAGDASWRRLVADPVSGNLLDYGRSTYRPPAALRRFIEARDRTCRFPTCRRPAQHCDIDHAIAWDAGGHTSAMNCGCLCRRHHRMKTIGGWKLASQADGSASWTSPSGHTYEVRPPPVLGDP